MPWDDWASLGLPLLARDTTPGLMLCERQASCLEGVRAPELGPDLGAATPPCQTAFSRGVGEVSESDGVGGVRSYPLGHRQRLGESKCCRGTTGEVKAGAEARQSSPTVARGGE